MGFRAGTVESMGAQVKGRVLVTGHSGFLGRAVTAELLARGWEVTGLSRHAALEPRPGLEQVRLDLLDAEAVAAFFRQSRFGALIHLAWYVGPKCHGHDVNLDWLGASLHLLRCFQASGGRLFQANGTVSEYDMSFGWLTEHTPLESPSLHGQCKAALFRTAGRFCQAHGMAFKWARPFNLYGPHERAARLMPSVMRAALRGEDIRVSACTQLVDYLYVEDTARGIADVFESDACGAVNVCSGRPVPLREVVERIASLAGFRGNILWGALPAAVDQPLIAGDCRRLMALGWSPRVPLDEGLERTLAWMRRHDV